MSRIFAAIDRIDSQWLTTWVLSAMVATLVLATVLSAAVARSTSGRRRRCSICNSRACIRGSRIGPRLARWPGRSLRRWKTAGVIDDARTAQGIDFAFPIAYGFFFLGLAAALWPAQPDYPRGARWVWGIGLGALAALLDEGENAFLWFMLARPDQDPVAVVPLSPPRWPIGKYALLRPVVLILVLALAMARA